MGATAGILYGLKTGLDFLGQRDQARQSEAMGRYEKSAFDENARIAGLQATDATARGDVEAGRVHLDTTQRMGATKAALASQGVDVGSGSALDVQASEAGLGALDEMMVRNNAAREAWGYSTEAINFRKQGELAELGGKNTAKAYKAQSVSTLLTGAANLYGSYSQSQRNKAELSGNTTSDLRSSQYKSRRY